MHALATLAALNAPGAPRLAPNWAFDGGSTYGGSDGSNVAAHSAGEFYPVILERFDSGGIAGPYWELGGFGLERGTVVFRSYDAAAKVARRLAVCSRSEDAWCFALERAAKRGESRVLFPADLAEVSRACGFSTFAASAPRLRILALVYAALYRAAREDRAPERIVSELFGY